MLNQVEYKTNFLNLCEKNGRPVIVYGAGENMKQFVSQLDKVDMVCDKRADQIKCKLGYDIFPPNAMRRYTEDVNILVTVEKQDIYSEICTELSEYGIHGYICHAYNNIAFGYSFWETAKSYTYKKGNDDSKISVNIVCREEAWIFKKFAEKMREYLINRNIDVRISSNTRDDVDINHHIPYVAYKPYKNDTLMITHVDNMKKVLLLKKQLEVAKLGICMSKDTLNTLVSYGIPRDKLCYVNPAQDGVIRPKKYLIGITHKCHDQEDVRKRADALVDVLKGIDPNYFRFFIMGMGWERVVEKISDMGFEVNYFPEFLYDRYCEQMQEIDYFLYMGFDEGTMGYLDALAAGAGTIVTPQGYHLDVECKIDYPCSNVEQFHKAFLDLEEKRKRKVCSVEKWTWDNYAQKHLEIWEYILNRKSIQELFRNQLLYEDGIFSIMTLDNRI